MNIQISGGTYQNSRPLSAPFNGCIFNRLSQQVYVQNFALGTWGRWELLSPCSTKWSSGSISLSEWHKGKHWTLTCFNTFLHHLSLYLYLSPPLSHSPFSINSLSLSVSISLSLSLVLSSIHCPHPFDSVHFSLPHHLSILLSPSLSFCLTCLGLFTDEGGSRTERERAYHRSAVLGQTWVETHATQGEGRASWEEAPYGWDWLTHHFHRAWSILCLAELMKCQAACNQSLGRTISGNIQSADRGKRHMVIFVPLYAVLFVFW